jgi:hypothetical protein
LANGSFQNPSSISATCIADDLAGHESTSGLGREDEEVDMAAFSDWLR